MSPKSDVPPTFRRHRDGSIDFDHYRTRAAAFRGVAKRDTAKVKAMLQFVAVITFATVGAVSILNAPEPVVADNDLRIVASHSAHAD
jgi:hypothetical protein